MGVFIFLTAEFAVPMPSNLEPKRSMKCGIKTKNERLIKE